MVVVVGDTVTVAAAAGLEPELAVHTNGPAPLEVNVTLCPTQIGKWRAELSCGAPLYKSTERSRRAECARGRLSTHPTHG